MASNAEVISNPSLLPLFRWDRVISSFGAPQATMNIGGNLWCSFTMADIGPTWDDETISFLLGLSPRALSDNTIRIEMFSGFCNDCDVSLNNSRKNTRTAKIYFADHRRMKTIAESYQGLAVPMTHGYHHYIFSDITPHNHNGDKDWIENDEGSSATAESPPLHLQLMALPTKELERRLSSMYTCTNGIEFVTKPCCDKTRSDGKNNSKRNRTCKVHKHAKLATDLAVALRHSRPVHRCHGIPVTVQSTEYLLSLLRCTTLWPPREKQRKGVYASRYLTVRKHHPPEQDELWNLCKNLIVSIIPDAIYNALAITSAFKGSPHIDNHDTTFQHVIALGDFTGGYLCCESDDGGAQVLEIDVNHKFARIDGRGVHWVSGWTGERYSIVYYSTAKEHWTERVCQSKHTKWMKNSSMNEW